MRKYEVILWGIIAAFIGYELTSHFTKYKYGRTLSNIIETPEHSKILAIALGTRVLIVLALIALGVHLQGVY